jgi:hypothetical protein
MTILLLIATIGLTPMHYDKATGMTYNHPIFNYNVVIKKSEQDKDKITQYQVDTVSQVFMAVLMDGIDKVNATLNDSTIFIVKKDQAFLYFNDPHTAFLANGEYAYITPEQIKKTDKPFFKFNFSKWRFIKDKDYELYQTAKLKGLNLNLLIRKIQNKDLAALLKFYNLHKYVDGTSAAEFPEDFWALINLWTDKELSTFILTLTRDDKKGFCQLLFESSLCNPKTYYKLYYPLTLKVINSIK